MCDTVLPTVHFRHILPEKEYNYNDETSTDHHCLLFSGFGGKL